MIYIIKGKDEIYACTNGRRQAIFDLNGTLALGENLEKEDIKKLKDKGSFSKLEKAVLKNNIKITLCDQHRITRFNNLSELSITETETPLELLSRHATDHTQFGFCTKKGTKTLYGRDLGLRCVPDYFKGIFGTSESRTELSYKIHDTITGYLQNFDYESAKKLILSYTKLDFDSFISKILFTVFTLNKKQDTEKKKLGRILVGSSKENSLAEEALYTIRTTLSLPAYSYEHIPFIDVRCPKKDEQKVEKELKQNYEAFIAKTVTLPTLKVSQTSQRYTNLHQIGAYEAQEITGGEGINVGVIDTGIDYEHEQLKENFGEMKGYDFVHETATPQDDNGHGSHVAGIIAGMEVGVAPRCNLYALKALDARGYGNEADLLSAIDWAIGNGMHILNMSLGSAMHSTAELAAINAALNAGIIIAAAAGNDGDSSYNYPASYPGVLSVAAVDYKNEHAYFSNHNDMVFISAPGVDIFSCYKRNSYNELSGTSMATPHVSGTAALVLSLAANAHLEEIFEATAKKLDRGKNSHLYFGAGLVKADDAVASLLQKYAK